MMNITDFGPAKPTIQPYQGGYSVPVGLYQELGPGPNPDDPEVLYWKGYLLFMPFLSLVEFDEKILEAPLDDYSAERYEVQIERTRLDRVKLYPPADGYTYAVASNDTAAITAFEAAVADVNTQYPLPVEAPYTLIYPYIDEPNSGPKSGFRPTYFYNLDKAVGPTVDVTVSGDLVLPAPGTFTYTATGVDPTQPLADFLAAVVAGLGTQTDVYFGVERDDTCLSIAGQSGYTINKVMVTIA
jgi:hypothetical protein